MDFLGLIYEVIKYFWDPTYRYIDHHRKPAEHMNELRRKVDALKSRKKDVESIKDAELRHRKEVKKEVENWFKEVQRVKTEMKEIEKKFCAVSYLLCGHLGKFLCGKIEGVMEIYQQGCFPDGVAVDGPSIAGMTLATPNLEGEINMKEQISEYLMGEEVGMIGVCGMGGIGKTTIMKHINNQLLKDN
ncbi:PREDICTED: probable disease resistance protein At5g63020 [Theobroma cacao]|uniref:Probable disease resistance protein At5g63020 n=1 Tax=Theobroma cacao TaxID=3641 RepID=A0AB32WKZ8_THECC|nr:PREDICTED: probable disease resistance protein At5g63020 [Theobroma cacao]